MRPVVPRLERDSQLGREESEEPGGHGGLDARVERHRGVVRLRPRGADRLLVVAR